MSEIEKQKGHIEKAIERARDGVSVRIDELDSKLRTRLDLKALARENAPQLAAGGAVIGFLVGFGFPTIVKRTLLFGVPLVLVAYKIKQSTDDGTAGARSEI